MSGLIFRNGQREGSVSWLSVFAGPLLSAFVAAMSAGLVTYVGVQKEMASLSVSVQKISQEVTKLTSDQDNFFKSQYLPLLLKVEKQASEIAETKSSVSILKEEMRMYHPVGLYNETRHIRK